MSALVLLSGGQDSTTALYWARERFDRVHTLTIRYGQRHDREVRAAFGIARLAAAVHEFVEIPVFRGSKSTLVSPGRMDATANGLPVTFVPARNLVFLSVAAARAASLGCSTIVAGVCATDHAGYPDCRPEFIEAMRAVLRAAIPAGVDLVTPMLMLDKPTIVRLGRSLPGCWDALALSVTCYRGDQPGCGECPSCVLRARGFAEAGERDPAS